MKKYGAENLPAYAPIRDALKLPSGAPDRLTPDRRTRILNYARVQAVYQPTFADRLARWFDFGFLPKTSTRYAVMRALLPVAITIFIVLGIGGMLLPSLSMSRKMAKSVAVECVVMEPEQLKLDEIKELSREDNLKYEFEKLQNLPQIVDAVSPPESKDMSDKSHRSYSVGGGIAVTPPADSASDSIELGASVQTVTKSPLIIRNLYGNRGNNKEAEKKRESFEYRTKTDEYLVDDDLANGPASEAKPAGETTSAETHSRRLGFLAEVNGRIAQELPADGKDRAGLRAARVPFVGDIGRSSGEVKKDHEGDEITINIENGLATVAGKDAESTLGKRVVVSGGEIAGGAEVEGKELGNQPTDRSDRSGLTDQPESLELANRPPVVLKGLWASGSSDGNRRASRMAALRPYSGAHAPQEEGAKESIPPMSVVAPAAKPATRPALSGPAGVIRSVEAPQAPRDSTLSTESTESTPSTEPPSSEPPSEPPASSTFRAAGFNPFVEAAQNAFSTFSIDVDTASYTLTRNYLMQDRLPPPEAVRTEEIVNYFDYHYPAPVNTPFAVHAECAPAPFGPGLQLLRIGVKARHLGREENQPAMLLFLIDTSGSMSTPDRLDLVKQSLRLLVNKLAPGDRVAIVQYDSHARLVLDYTPASDKARILQAIDALQTSGSTNLEEGMRLAYDLARRAFQPGAANRVLLLSDGAANLGSASAEPILATVADSRRQGIFCSVYGVGRGGYNDVMLETLANKGDGVYTFLDSLDEAKRVFVDDLAATLNTIASDVKIQVEFNPGRVKVWRQLGYENRALRKEDFRNDAIDAGEVGSGQSVTALYELSLVPNSRGPLGTVRVRCRDLRTGRVEERGAPLTEAMFRARWADADASFKLAACAAELAEILRGSPFAGDSDPAELAALLRPVALDYSLDARVQELLRLVEKTADIKRGSN